MTKTLNFVAYIFILALLHSCMGNQDKKNVNTANNTENQISTTGDSAKVVAEIKHPGKVVYDKYCLTCHQADGSGVPNMHPPLGPGSWMDRNPDELIAIMMKGLSGKIEVNGEVYNSFMPSHARLTDEEIADVLSYIRVSFGNNLEAITAEQVKQYRKGK